jgi:hypothetical protein
LEEQRDEVKRMNQMILYSKCATVRDMQVWIHSSPELFTFAITALMELQHADLAFPETPIC